MSGSDLAFSLTLNEPSPAPIAFSKYSRKDAQNETRNLIKGAKESIDISTHTFSWFDSIQDVIEAKAKSGVNVSVLLSNPEDLPNPLREATEVVCGKLVSWGCKVSFVHDRLPFRGAIVDGRVAVVMLFPTASQSNDDITTAFSVVRNEVLVKSLYGYLKSLNDASTFVQWLGDKLTLGEEVDSKAFYEFLGSHPKFGIGSYVRSLADRLNAQALQSKRRTVEVAASLFVVGATVGIPIVLKFPPSASAVIFACGFGTGFFIFQHYAK